MAFSYRVISPSFIDVELAGPATGTNRFVAVTFANNGQTPSLECLAVNGQPPVLRVPDIDDNLQKLQNPGFLAFRQQYLSDVRTMLQNDTTSYCQCRELLLPLKIVQR
ncbi:hypothetical protein COOONC_19969 [Cooperia oncophora]